MKKKKSILTLIVMMTFIALSSCSWNMGSGDMRERNIEKATLAHLDSIPRVKFIGLSDTHDQQDGNFNAVVIFEIPDSNGNMEEHNARVVTNYNGNVLYSWEDLDCQILDEVKQKVSDKLEEKGIPIDDSLIDALINLKRR